MIHVTFCPLSQGESDPASLSFASVHGIWIVHRVRSSPASLIVPWNETVPSLAYILDADHVLVKLSCFVKPLLPLPSGVFLPRWKGCRSHHGGQLLSDPPLLKSINEDCICLDSTVSLGESESCGVLVKVTMAVSCHGEGVDGLAG